MATNHRFLDRLGVFDRHPGTNLVASISNNSAVQRNVVGLLFQTFLLVFVPEIQLSPRRY
eukprot:scaffold8751_cov35-Attheya_sp.AAC.1